MVGIRRSSRIQHRTASESEASDINTDDESVTSSARKSRRRSTKTLLSTTKSTTKERIPPTVEEDGEETVTSSEVNTAVTHTDVNNVARSSFLAIKKVKKSPLSNKSDKPQKTGTVNSSPVKRTRIRKIIKVIDVSEAEEDDIIEEKEKEVLENTSFNDIPKKKTKNEDFIKLSVADEQPEEEEERKDFSKFLSESEKNIKCSDELKTTEAESIPKAEKINVSTKSGTSNFKPIFKVDLRKYETVGKGNSGLLLLSSELKSHFPFKDHLKQLKNKGQGIPTATSGDVFGLDGVQLKDSEDSEEPQIQCKLSTQNVSTSIALKKAAEMDVNKLMKKSVLPEDMEKEKNCPKFYESKFAKIKERKQKAQETAGPGWYNLPRTEITDEIKRDLQVIKMRGTLDTKHHYKRSDSKKFPKFFQMGTVVEGAHEFYSSRVSKKARKRTMVDELLADAQFRKKNKKRMIEYELKKQSGGKGYYKKKMEKRKPTHART